MTQLPRQSLMALIACIAMTTAACTTTPSAGSALSAGSQATVDGTIAAIDTQPWTYDGNAIVLLDTAKNGRVSVQLPARWNLCKAGQVDVASLVVGKRARAIGTVTDDGAVVVCERTEHRLGMLD